MTLGIKKARAAIDELLRSMSVAQLRERLSPDFSPAPPRLRNAKHITESAVLHSWEILTAHTHAAERDRDLLFDPGVRDHMTAYERNIENFIGTVRLPVGVAGPLRVNGIYAQGDYYLPLATTEAALVASYHRGSMLLTEAGGATTILLSEGLNRAPCFIFGSLAEVGEFVVWATENFDKFQQTAAATTSHGHLQDMLVTVEGNHVYLNFEYSTGDASGQNMATIATEAILHYILEASPQKPLHVAIESNFSGDKKASFLSFLGVRGKKVTAEANIKSPLVEKYLHTTVKDLVRQWQAGALGAVMSGTVGVQSHYANALAAVFIATGQDAACVSEASVGVTRLEEADNGGLYAAVTLPNLVVGTVGGGTKLPTQAACARIARTDGPDHAREFAEVCAALCLAGELSIIGAICAGHFARAHQKLARGTGG
jgi:hydroxymethylglutaryl-CoA reductase (NADPH)